MKGILLFIALTLGSACPAFAAYEALFSDMQHLADQNQPEAQYHLGMFYNNGVGTPENAELAFKWFKKSAQGGDPLGSYKLGCYYGGQGAGVIALDLEQALHHKLVAAQAGYSLAQHDAAYLYFQNGNYKEAFYWLSAAAEQGFLDSLYPLPTLYYEGKGVEQDYYQAYLHLKRIEKLSETEFPEDEKVLGAQITAADKIKAEQAVANWQPKPSPLTLQARNGLQEAIDYVAKHK